MSSSICILPARYHSTRLPGKLLKKVQGKTILQRSFENALRFPHLEGVYIATSDERIAEHARSFHAPILWTKSDCINGTDRIRDALLRYPELQKASFIVNAQADHPTLTPEWIHQLIHLLQTDSGASMSTLAAPLKDPERFTSPHAVKTVFNAQGRALYFSRAPIPYQNPTMPLSAWVHIGIYAFRRSFLEKEFSIDQTPLQTQEDLEQLALLEQGYAIQVGVVDEIPQSIDTLDDLTQFEQSLCPLNTSL